MRREEGRLPWGLRGPGSQALAETSFLGQKMSILPNKRGSRCSQQSYESGVFSHFTGEDMSNMSESQGQWWDQDSNPGHPNPAGSL